MNAVDVAGRIAKAACRSGYVVLGKSHASTGSVYLTLTRGGYDVQVRVADHAEAYAPTGRGVRRLCVSPFEMTADDAIAALDDPAAIERVSAAKPVADDETRRQMAAEAKFQAAWRALRGMLPEQAFAEFRRLGGNRPAARAVAERYRMSVALVYSAITNGKKFQKSLR